MQAHMGIVEPRVNPVSEVDDISVCSSFLLHESD